MTLLLTGISNENEFYTNYYLSEVLETDLRDIGARWQELSEKQGTKIPSDQLRSKANDYFRFKNNFDRESDSARRLVLQRGFSQELLSVFGYKQELVSKVLDDGQVLPLLCEVVRATGEPELWVVESFSPYSAERKSTDEPLSQAINLIQYSDAVDSGQIVDISLDDVVSKIVFSQSEPPRWVMVVSDSQILLIDRTKWNDQRLLRFDLEEIFARRESSTLCATCTLLHHDSLISPDGQVLLDTLDEKSHKHSQGVTYDLKYALQQSIEIIGNEAIHYLRTKAKEKVFERDIEKQLTHECLRFMYRLLFILYIEARAELGSAPMNSDEYRLGYSFESLRDLEVFELTTEESNEGFYIHDSIKLLFDLVYHGYPEIEGGVRLQQLVAALPPANHDDQDERVAAQGFEIFPMRSHLFDPSKTKLLNKVRLRNSALLQVLKLMSLSKSKGTKQRSGRISYAQLGINQLGAVYEALLCFNGFFAEKDLYEVQPAQEKDKKATEEDEDDSDFEVEQPLESSTAKKSKGKQQAGRTRDALEIAYLVPLEDLEQYTIAERVYDESGRQKKYDKGTFIYRLAGRDRQKSASYYTPEVLTKCLVKYSLKELLKDKTADQILELKVCEPAMGSAAFLNECVNQLAEAYLERKQIEIDMRIPHDQYSWEKQRVKMYIADRNVFGIDLNPVAVELAEVSLWLNSIYKGAFVPWFGMQLLCGNSLVGARRQVFAQELLQQKKKGSTLWYATEPVRVKPGERRPEDTIYHFLLPDPGMSKYDDKAVKELAKEHIQRIEAWRGKFVSELDVDEVRRLTAISDSIDKLWSVHIEKLRIVRAGTTDSLTIFGKQDSSTQKLTSTEQKDSQFLQEGLAAELVASSSYQVLKLIMDYWCALWFWPILHSDKLPTRKEYIEDLERIIAIAFTSECTDGKSLNALANLVNDLERLQVVRNLSAKYRFLHWELEYADLFEDNGGFDLVIGNPPWIKLEWQESGVLSDHDPSFVVKAISASETAKRRKDALIRLGILPEYLEAYEESASTQYFLNAMQNYSLLKGVQSNSFKCFLPQGWMIAGSSGVVSYIHPDGVYDDPKGGILRKAMYERLLFHFQHTNELILFPVHHNTVFSLNVYSNRKTDQFYSISNLFHPKTIYASFEHDGTGVIPGIKNADNKWELAGHKDRIVIGDRETLELFASLYDPPGTPAEQARFPAIHSKSLVDVLRSFAYQPLKLAQLKGDLIATVFWDETNSVKKDGTIRRETRFVDSLEQFVCSGPHFHVGNPLFKTPRRICTANGHYDPIDLTNIPDAYQARTNYVPDCPEAEYRRRIPDSWDGMKITDYYRVIARKMLSPATERTLISCIIPPKVAHTNGAISFAVKEPAQLISIAAQFFSLPFDFYIKSTGKSNLYNETIESLPLLHSSTFYDSVVSRVLRLNCVNESFRKLWEEHYSEELASDYWSSKLVESASDLSFHELERKWSFGSAVRQDLVRRQALLELDVIVAISLGLTNRELVDMYRIQFPVMRQYDADTYYDQTGRIVFTASKGLPGVGLDRKKWEEVRHQQHGTVERVIEDDTMPGGPIQRKIIYQAPFFSMNRERDYEVAWKEFTNRLGVKHSVVIQKDDKMSSLI